jgi:hypothetical protein
LRKLTAILLISIFLFNAGGYQVLHRFLQHELDKRLETQFDRHTYDEARLVSIKIPSARLPYCSSSRSFERVNGEIEMNGKLYKFVQRRIFNDSLEFLCIPDPNSMQLRMAKNEFFKLVNDLQTSTQGKKSNNGSHIYKILSSDYCSVSNDLSLQVSLNLSSYGDTYSSGKIDPIYLSPAGQPPDAA